jgi:hypothetical protein
VVRRRAVSPGTEIQTARSAPAVPELHRGGGQAGKIGLRKTLLFVNKKKQKNFLHGFAEGAEKVFCALFFKKAPLPCFRGTAPCQT